MLSKIASWWFRAVFLSNDNENIVQCIPSNLFFSVFSVFPRLKYSMAQSLQFHQQFVLCQINIQDQRMQKTKYRLAFMEILRLRLQSQKSWRLERTLAKASAHTGFSAFPHFTYASIYIICLSHLVHVNWKSGHVWDEQAVYHLVSSHLSAGQQHYYRNRSTRSSGLPASSYDEPEMLSQRVNATICSK